MPTVRDAIDSTRAFLRDRRQSYRELVAFLRHPGRNRPSPAAQDALRDLAIFCRANESCWHPDPRVHAALEGRREVWLRLQQHLNMSQEELEVIYTGGTLPAIAEESEDA